jgi:hypothetical protein
MHSQLVHTMTKIIRHVDAKTVVDSMHCTLKLFPDRFIHHGLSAHPRLALKCFCYYINAETHK